MKKITLLVASILLFGSVANASEIIRKSGEEKRTRFSFDEPISFTERGIEFFVFPNGEFDFNTRPDDSEGDYFYKTAGKRGSSQERKPMNYGTRIEHDSFGRVRRIGNTFINYDSRDRVNRIGSVYMRYNRTALTQIGAMRIVYNRRGEIIDTIGNIKSYSGYAYNCSNYYDDDNYTASNYNESDYYYYKQDGTKAKVEDDKERK
ncbi:hypothetical protein QWY90_08170 [Flavobacterium paronense]|uniref:Uncharacterized protein n=1 Tax=Flavobacterium paronense TaxID=1392775 RepID=A0ABV5GH04_9FLAO|nr:hypothetical protein [Flavobacterium paronense]MDN3677289.1 hypothetical protein [Flavobacterium paronense]